MTHDPKSTLRSAAAFIEDVEENLALAELVAESTLIVSQEPDYSLEGVDSDFPHWYPLTLAKLTVPGELYDVATASERTIGCALNEATDSAIDEWTLEAGPTRSWSNQGASFDRSDAPYVWEGMRHRSPPEVRIAEALDRAGVDYLPNCLIRHGEVGDRRSIEPDFLVLAYGRVGILEVDGGAWHTRETAAAEHVRDRRSRLEGRIAERYEAVECDAFPDRVVADFLAVMRGQPRPPVLE